MLNHLFGTVGENVLIEVEKPTDDESRRRISFYEKNGFRLREDINYVQPPTPPNSPGVEMLLMTHGDVKLRDTRDLREISHGGPQCRQWYLTRPETDRNRNRSRARRSEPLVTPPSFLHVVDFQQLPGLGASSHIVYAGIPATVQGKRYAHLETEIES